MSRHLWVTGCVGAWQVGEDWRLLGGGGRVCGGAPTPVYHQALGIRHESWIHMETQLDRVLFLRA